MPILRMWKGRWHRFHLLLALALAFALCTLPAGVAGAESAVEVLSVGWDGVVMPNSWSPVRVRVTGGSADTNGVVEVILKYRYQVGGPQSPSVEHAVASYGQEVALPAGVAKEITIWTPADGGMVGVVRLTTGEQIVAEQRVEFRSAGSYGWPLVGVLAEASGLARSVAQIEMPFQGLPIPIGVARLTTADLPTDADRFRAVGILIVQGNAAATTTREQRQAVLKWVEAGGYLLLIGGPSSPRTVDVLPEGAIAARFSGADEVADLSELAEWTGVRENAPTSGPAARLEASVGSLLAGTPQRPLAWRVGVGQGSVTLLAVDPTLQPLSSWGGAPALLRKAMEPALPSAGDGEKLSYVRMVGRNNPWRLQGAVEAMPEAAFPGWQMVALVLGGFTVVVGPLLHIVLSRIDRRGWVWVIVPLLAVLTSGSLYYLGVGREGRDVLTNVVSYVQLQPQSGRAQQLLTAGFFAPTHERLVVSLAGDAPLMAYVSGMEPMWGPYGPVQARDSRSVEPPYRVIAGRDTRVEFTGGQWSMRGVHLSRTLEGQLGLITARLGLEGGLIKGTVRNDTPFQLENAVVVVGQSVTKLGTLAPGQTAQVVLDPGPVVNPMEGWMPFSYRVFGEPVAANQAGAATYGSVVTLAPMTSSLAPPGPWFPGPPQQLVVPQEPEVQRRVRLMDAVMDVAHVGPGAPAMPLTFMAYTQDQVGPNAPSAGDHPTYLLSLIAQPLMLDLPSGPFILPAALTPVETLEQSTAGMGYSSSGTMGWVELHGGSAVFGFRPPMPARATAEAIIITTRQVGAAVSLKGGREIPPPPFSGTDPIWGAAEAGVFSVYNWQAAAWEALPGGQEEARLSPAAPYLGPDGLVKVQVETPEDYLLRFVVPELTVEGTVAE